MYNVYLFLCKCLTVALNSEWLLTFYQFLSSKNTTYICLLPNNSITILPLVANKQNLKV